MNSRETPSSPAAGLVNQDKVLLVVVILFILLQIGLAGLAAFCTYSTFFQARLP